jgi:hypothetical protein
MKVYPTVCKIFKRNEELLMVSERLMYVMRNDSLGSHTCHVIASIAEARWKIFLVLNFQINCAHTPIEQAAPCPPWDF